MEQGGAWGAIWHWKGGWDQAKTEGGKGPSPVFWGEPFDQGNHLCKAAWTVPGCSRSSCVAGGSGQRGGGQEMRGEAAAGPSLELWLSLFETLEALEVF